MKRVFTLASFVIGLGSGVASNATTVYLTSDTSWTVPSDWNSSNNSIEVIGAGGGGQTASSFFPGSGGGGGGFSKIANLPLTPGSHVVYAVGVGGAAGSAGGDTWFNGVSLNAAAVGAKGGGGGAVNAGGRGGSAALGIGSTKLSGGDGGTIGYNPAGGGGGGGAAGPNGSGAAGASDDTGGAYAGNGGGGNGGGKAGNSQAFTTGGSGGNAYDGSAGGAGGTTTTEGGNGSHGSGGGGGAGASVGPGTAGGAGGAGNEYAAAGYGSGGGGGGGGGSDTGAVGTGGGGGSYGGGGGGGGWSATARGIGATGGGGLIVINYTPAPQVSGVCGSANGVGVTSAPTTGLCTAGIASSVTGAGPWNWRCAGSNGGSSASCGAPLLVNGVCGEANNVPVILAPTTGLCSAGTASSVTGTGSWSWTCAGSNGGSNASCQAAMLSPKGVSPPPSLGWKGIDPNNTTIFIAPRAMTIASIAVVIDTPVGDSATGTVWKAPSGIACGASGSTALHSGSFDANGNPGTTQILTLNDTALSAGDRVCITTTGGGWTGNGTGTISITVY